MDAASTDNLGLTEHPFNFHVEQMLWAWSAALFSLKPKLSKLKYTGVCPVEQELKFMF